MSTLRIKRSNSTNAPGSLAEGELAYSSSSSPNGIDELFVGGPSASVVTLVSGSGAEANQTITTGLGIDGAEAGSSGDITINFDPNELTNVTAADTDWIVIEDSTDNAPKKVLISSLSPLDFTSNLSANVFLGNTGVAGSTEELTGTQATALLDTFSTTTTTAGTVPGSNNGGASVYLDGSGNWSSPGGSGDVTGPGSSVDNNVAVFSGTTGKIISDDGWSILDEDDMVSNSATDLATQQSIKAYVDSVATSEMTYQGGFDPTASAGAGSPNLNTITSAVGDMYTVTAAGTYNFTTGTDPVLEVGDVLISEVAGVNSNGDNWTVVQNNIGAATTSVAGYVILSPDNGSEIIGNTGTDNATKAVTARALANGTIDGGTF